MQKTSELIRKIATGISVPEAYKVRNRTLPSGDSGSVPDYIRERRPPRQGEKPELWEPPQKRDWSKALKSPIKDLFKKVAEMLKNEKYKWEKTEKGDAKTLKYKSPFTGKEFHVSP